MKLIPDSKIVSQARLIVEAAEKGLEIQEGGGGIKWRDVSAGVIALGADYEYRIKPEPKMVWVNEYPDGGRRWAHDTEADARSQDIGFCTRVAVPYREVTDN